jgi:hypothetical protein
MSTGAAPALRTLSGMGNVNLPTPVALAGAALCVLAGYLIGAVASADTTSRTTATVASYDQGSGRLCLKGDGIKGQEGALTDGELCGTWRRTTGSSTPRAGEEFRFVTISPAGESGEPGHAPVTFIYGNVVR